MEQIGDLEEEVLGRAVCDASGYKHCYSNSGSGSASTSYHGGAGGRSSID